MAYLVSGWTGGQKVKAIPGEAVSPVGGFVEDDFVDGVGEHGAEGRFARACSGPVFQRGLALVHQGLRRDGSQGRIEEPVKDGRSRLCPDAQEDGFSGC